VLTELEKLEKNVNDCEVECQIIGIKDDLDFLNDVKQYMDSASPELKEKLELWADNSFKFVPIVQEEYICPREVRILKGLPIIFENFFLAEGLGDALFEVGGILGKNADGFACSRDGNIPLF